ncbi:hypothetical protein [Modestobacter excelsi]|uniref:hypothetical protein n=1 Tax=Modestobacter excelsi TaxID=2213161 RepID=UPI00110CA013|nr:hypothetical protein [Modestobacter excelsi]
MNTPADVAHSPSSSHPHPLPPADELGLAELLELFGTEEPALPPVRPSLRSSGARLLMWWRDSSRRAARWGAVPGPAGTFGGRPVRTAVPAVRS